LTDPLYGDELFTKGASLNTLVISPHPISLNSLIAGVKDEAGKLPKRGGGFI
jgi:hypothetical protein